MRILLAIAALTGTGALLAFAYVIDFSVGTDRAEDWRHA